jgi:hypothetical protein
MYIVTRLDVPGKLSFDQYRKLPIGSEVIVWDRAPLDFLDKDVMFTVARERQYKIRKVNRHWSREFMKQA